MSHMIVLNEFGETVEVGLLTDAKIFDPEGKPLLIGLHSCRTASYFRSVYANIVSETHYALKCRECGRIPGTTIPLKCNTLKSMAQHFAEKLKTA